MVDRDQEKATTDNTTTGDMFLKKKELLSTAMKRTSEWYVSEF